MRKWKLDKKGEGYIDVIVILLIVITLLALILKVVPVFTAKNNLDNFATEIIREAEIVGQVGSEVEKKIKELNQISKMTPTIVWNCEYISGTKKVQLGDEMEVTLTMKVNIGFFEFGSFPIELQSKARGKSETYWK